ncbi:sirohydrochlorin chelatase [uncultured Planococcus sp.]|uniref:sirohydrochlorin chelatase n=1 Tax=uncultured Planococcus sp. TaxID=337815 RepID=UPI00261F89E1|nr:sirohydrochlorin chelatase [uncultured Planococcus sp.]
MQAVLYVSHGSRVKETRQEAMAFMEQVHLKVDVALHETCFLELASPDIGEGIDSLVEQGATAIAVVPVLLLSAGHYYEDIPDEVKKSTSRYPDIRFTYGKPLGVQDRLVEILAERLQETGVQRLPEAKVLLVGRGGKSSEITRSVEEIAAKLAVKANVANVDVCYLAAADPSFDEGLQASINSGSKQIFVVPYLWFTGLLVKSMQKKISGLSSDEQQIILCGYLGDHPSMVDALAERVHEALQNEQQPAW